MGKNALRVLAIACRELDELPEEISSETLEKDLTFVGLLGMIDPPREESRDAVAKAHSAGIRTVMITGDHVVTAGAIAKQLGILEEGQTAISGQELAQLSEEELEENVDRFAVYARVTPEDKIRIVKAWQAKGEVVAMTGDGVNDAPALKAADIGCAMGITGTDVAKGAADMVLTDDNFSTIIEAVHSGRGIYDNIRKTVQFLLGSNLGEVFTVFFAIIFGWGSPLLAIHLLLVNVITDAFPALALGVEPTDDNVMGRKPVPRGQGIFAGGMGLAIVLQGIMIGILTLAGYMIGSFVEVSPLFPQSHEVGTTMAFLVLAISQLTQAINCRSKGSIFKVGFFSNPTMLKAVMGSLALILLIFFVPPLKAIFKLVSLSMGHWLVVAGLAVAPFVIVEIAKLIISLVKNRE
jgi:Ca2+-transporting ATPase